MQFGHGYYYKGFSKFCMKEIYTPKPRVLGLEQSTLKALHQWDTNQ